MKRAVFLLLFFGALLLVRASCVYAEFLPPTKTEQDKAVIKYVPTSSISLKTLQKTEWKNASPELLCVLKKADELARRGVEYRYDSPSTLLTREDLKHSPASISCSELIWYVYSACGLDLGDHHIETKEMAYSKGVYAKAFRKVLYDRIRPGDILVYEYSLHKLKREEALTGRYHSGHVVIVVSSKKKIVIGSHYLKSSPGDVLPGVGYRKLLKGWNQWTAGRTLKAVYRVRSPK